MQCVCWSDLLQLTVVFTNLAIFPLLNYKRPVQNPTSHCLKYQFYYYAHIYATSWTIRGSNTGWGEIFSTRPDRPWVLPSLLNNGHRVIPGGKAAGVWR